MAAHLLHPQLAQTLRAIGHRIGAWAVPDDDVPTLILEQPVDMAAARPLHRIAPQTSAPACAGSCCQGRTPCRTPDACAITADQADDRNTAADAIVLCACTAVLAVWGASLIAGATWADALRVLVTLVGA